MRPVAIAAAALAALCGTANGQGVCTPTTAIISANAGSPGATLPASFVGINWDINSLGLGSGNFNGSNTALINLYKLLNPGGPVGGTLKIGGNGTKFDPASTVTTSMIQGASDLLAALGGAWTVYWSLNIGDNDAAAATAQVGRTEAVFGSGVVTYAIGDEEDDLNNFTNVTPYLARWSTFYTTITATYPAAIFNGPEIFNPIYSGPASINGGNSWIPPFVAADGALINSVSTHFYNAIPPTTDYQSYLDNWNAETAAAVALVPAQAGGKPAIFSETNTYVRAGNNIQNAAGAAALVDEALLAAQGGWASVDFQQNGGPFAFVSNATTPLPSPYFGVLMMTYNLNGKTILPTTVTGFQRLDALGLVDGTGKVSFLIVNRNATVTASIDITQSGAWTTQSVLIMTGLNALSSDTHTLIGGAQVMFNGVWTGAPVNVPKGTNFVLPAASSAYVVLN